MSSSKHNTESLFKSMFQSKMSSPQSICSMKSVTPHSLSKLSSYLTTCSSENQSFNPNSSIKKSQILNFSSDKAFISRSKSKKVRVQTAKLIESHIVIHKESLTPDKRSLILNYSEFKDYHLQGSKRRSSFIVKKPNSLFTTFKYKKPVLEPVKIEPEVEDERFIKNVIYKKPAMTYPEKLFRLNQVSIFN